MKMGSDNIRVKHVNSEKYNCCICTKYGYIYKNKERNFSEINKVRLEHCELKENVYRFENKQICKIILKIKDNNYICDKNGMNKYYLKKKSNLKVAKISHIKSIFNRALYKKEKKKVSFLEECKTLYYIRKMSQELICGINNNITNNNDEKKEKINFNEKNCIQDSCSFVKEKCEPENFNFINYNLKKNYKKEIIFNKILNKIKDQKKKNIASNKNMFPNKKSSKPCELELKGNQNICISNRKNIYFFQKNLNRNEKKIALIFNKNVLNSKKETVKEKDICKSFFNQINKNFPHIFNRRENLKVKKNNKIFKRNIKNIDVKKKSEEDFDNSNKDGKKLYCSNNTRDDYLRKSKNNNYNVSYLKLHNIKRFSLKNSTSNTNSGNNKIKIIMLKGSLHKNNESNNQFCYFNKNILKKTKRIFSNNVNLNNIKEDERSIYSNINKDINNQKRNTYFTRKIKDPFITKHSNPNFLKNHLDENIKYCNLKGTSINSKRVDIHIKAGITEKTKYSNKFFYIKTIQKNKCISDLKRNGSLIINREKEDDKTYIPRHSEKIERTRELLEDNNISDEKKPSKEIIDLTRQDIISKNENLIIIKKNYKKKVQEQEQIQEGKQQSIRKAKNIKRKNKNNEMNFKRYGDADKKKIHRNKQKESRYEQDQEMKKEEIKDKERKTEITNKEKSKESINHKVKSEVSKSKEIKKEKIKKKKGQIKKKSDKNEEIKSETKKNEDIINKNRNKKYKRLKIKQEKARIKKCKSNLEKEINNLKGCINVKNNSKRFKNEDNIYKIGIRKKKKKKNLEK